MDNIKSFKKYKNNIYTIQIKNLNKNIDSLRGNYGYFYEMNSKKILIFSKKLLIKKFKQLPISDLKKIYLKIF